MTYAPPSPHMARRAAQKKALRWLAAGASALSVLLVVIVFVLIVRTENAHDEGHCPFTAGETRTLGATTVREEARTCLPEVEERRYMVSRAGAESYELARKRLPKAGFASYRWALREDAGKLVVELYLGDKLDSAFHEEDVPKP